MSLAPLRSLSRSHAGFGPLSSAIVLLLLGGVGSVFGCSSNSSIPASGGDGGEASSGGGASGEGGRHGGAGGGTGGEGGGVAIDCSGEPTKTNLVDECGVFVQKDAPGSEEDGSKLHPYKTIQKGIDHAAGKRVYVCSSQVFEEAVHLSDPLEVFGGFDCASAWIWSKTARTELRAPVERIALTIRGDDAAGAKIENFTITAPDALHPSGSSIAVVVDDVSAKLVRCDIATGLGKPGELGTFPPEPKRGTDAPSPDPLLQSACINPGSVTGGPGGTTTCEDGTSVGGTGGKGGLIATNGGNGGSGIDGSPADAVTGKGGLGATSTADCEDGGAGADGADAAQGTYGGDMGTLWTGGIKGGDGGDGHTGERGQAGGGGGGDNWLTSSCAGAAPGNGASGGGGGGGGCGGRGGGGGKTGGSSIAIISLGAQLVLEDVTLATADAGLGGAGNGGHSGGLRGGGAIGGDPFGSAGSVRGCRGGTGGKGGDGGPGGGARGGHSIGLAYAVSPSALPVATFAGGVSGDGGKGGPGSTIFADGAKGIAAFCWDFFEGRQCE